MALWPLYVTWYLLTVSPNEDVVSLKQVISRNSEKSKTTLLVLQNSGTLFPKHFAKRSAKPFHQKP
jgi:hypothetical protein